MGAPIPEPTDERVRTGMDVDRMNVGRPVRPAGTSEEVAGAVASLASEDASCITGQDVRVDGGDDPLDPS